jgi:hypothetical protein
MITDAQTKFSDAQALTTGTVVSTNAYDMGVARDIGRGRDLRVFANVVTAFLGGTSIQANLIESANSDLSSATVIASGPVVPLASLTAGASLLDIPLPKTSKRYQGIQYVIVGTMTAGAVSAGMAMNTDSNTTFPAVTGF